MGNSKVTTSGDSALLDGVEDIADDDDDDDDMDKFEDCDESFHR